MTNKDKRHEDAADLRERAEEKFRADDAKTKKKLTPLVGRRSEAPAGVDFQGALKETRKMLHELRVHQIELEMQNENLRRAQAELDAARARYFDLYDLAPVGYCTVSEQGLILEANLTAAKLFGWERKPLVKQPLTSFILNEDQDVCYLYRKQLFESGAPQVCELRMLNKEGNHFWARLEAAVAQDADGALVGRVVLSDITERKQVESQKNAALEALQRSEENFRLSLEDSPLGVRIATAKGESIYANKVFLDLYGYESIDEFNGIPIKERYTPQSYAESQLRKKARDQGDFGPSVYEINIVRKNKEIRHLLVLRKEVLWNGTKQFQVIYQDITERKQAESQREDALAALRESEEKFRKIFEDHAAVKLLIEPESGAIIDANKAAERYYGWTRAELKRMHIQQINILPAEQVKIEMEKARQQKCVHFEFRHRRADGSIRDVEVFSSRIEMAGKDILHSIIHDITDRKRAESQREAVLEELRESEEKYRTLFTSSSDAIMLIEPLSGKFISGNQAMMEMFGLKNDDDFSSFGPWDFSPERQPDERASAEKAKEMNEIAMRDGSNFFEWSHKRLNGEEFSTNVRLTRMVLDKKTILQATVRDVTEHKRAEEKIRNSLAEKEVLLKEVHHRVKNNLMIIIGLIKMQETKTNNEMLNPLLQELEGRIRSMALVHESLHKAEDLAHVNLQNYIETMSAHIRAQFGVERDIRFRVQAAGVDVNLDIAVPCGLILNELITNAYKHAFPKDKPRAGEGNCEINVIVNQENGMNELTVADNGVGLPADLDWEKSEALGLRLIKMLSKQLNGSIELDSSAGTVFRLKFPVAVT